MGLSYEQGCTNCGSLAAWLRGNGQRMRKWRENEEMERFSLRMWQHLNVNTGVSEMYST